MSNLSKFYNSRAGRIVARILQKEVTVLWPLIPKSEIIGLFGFAGNYENCFSECKKICLTPSQIDEGEIMVDEQKLPLRDSELDRVFVIHALENAKSFDAVIPELWRVLKPNGKMIVILPNRKGLWKKRFGGKELYRQEVRLVLLFNKFSLLKFRRAVFVPPFLPLEFFDTVCRFILRPFCGVFIFEAEKLIYAPRGRTIKIIPSIWEAITKRGLRPAQ